MTSQVVLDSFAGSGTLAGTSPGVLTGVSAASWVTYDQALTANLAFQRSSAGATVVVPASGNTNFARLDISGNATHSAGLTVVEALVRPEFTMRIVLDFEDRTATLGVSTSGAGSWSMFNGTTGSGTFTAATPGATVALRIEVGPTQTQFFVDDVLVGTRTTTIPYGVRIEFVRFNFPRLTTHGLAEGSTVSALTYLHLKTEATTGALGGGSGSGGSDTAAPGFTGAVAVTFPTANSFTASWPAATDAVGVTGYEYSLNGGDYVPNGTSRTVTMGPIPTGVTTEFSVRAFDAAGNRSAALASTIYTPLVALQVGVPPAPFPLGTEWAVKQYAAEGSTTLSGHVGVIGVSGDGNTVAIASTTYTGGGGAVPAFTTRVYVKSGSSFTLVASLGSTFGWDLNSSMFVSLDWAGKRLVVLTGSRPELVDGSPMTRNRCLTYGLSTSGWVLISDQRFGGLRLFSNAKLSANGGRLVVLTGKPGDPGEPNGATVFAWDSTTWRTNEFYAYPPRLDGRRAVMGDSATALVHSPLEGYVFETPLSSGAVGAKTPGIMPDGYTAMVDLTPVLHNFGVLARYFKQVDGVVVGAELIELRKTASGWAQRPSAPVAERQFFNGSMAASEDGTYLHVLDSTPMVWTRYSRDAAITKLPAGYDPAVYPGYDPEHPDTLRPVVGPSNEPSENTRFSSFWSSFSKTYEVP